MHAPLKCTPLVCENNPELTKSGLNTGGVFLRSDYLLRGEIVHVLAALMPENRLACEISLATGLRISDVLNIRSDQLSERFSVRELKTGKRRLVRLPSELLDRAHAIKGKIYVFEGRTNHRKPRSRQAVYKDLKRAAALFRIDKKLQISPHSMRKVWSVEQLKRYGGNVAKVQQLLNHSDEAVTMLYVMSDVLTERKLHGKQ